MVQTFANNLSYHYLIMAPIFKVKYKEVYIFNVISTERYCYQLVTQNKKHK